MDPDNPVIKLCIAGTRAEFEHRTADARALYRQAWEAARDDFERCIAAHYVAQHQERPEDALHWHQRALRHARAAGDGRVQEFFPSLYLNLGHAHEVLGHQAQAQSYYALAAKLGAVHQEE